MDSGFSYTTSIDSVATNSHFTINRTASSIRFFAKIKYLLIFFHIGTHTQSKSRSISYFHFLSARFHLIRKNAGSYSAYILYGEMFFCSTLLCSVDLYTRVCSMCLVNISMISGNVNVAIANRNSQNSMTARSQFD